MCKMAPFSLEFSDADSRVFVKNQSELADSLDVSRRSLARWLKKYGDFPRPEANGLYRVALFREWLKEKTLSGEITLDADSDDDDSVLALSDSSVGETKARIAAADLRYREMRAKKAEREFEILDGKFIDAGEVEKRWSSAAAKLFALSVAKVSAALVDDGADAVAANMRAESIVNAVFRDFQRELDPSA